MSQLKKIAIIGGGISGLAVLHFLKKKYLNQPDIEIKLFEKKSCPGGTIQTQQGSFGCFEHGANAFLDNKKSTLEFIHEIGLESQLITADLAAKKRFIFYRQQLHALPSNPKEFFHFKPLSFVDKLRLTTEWMIPKGKNPKESVYEFGTRRFGLKFTELFLDPLMSGIYAGDVHRVSMQLALPKLFELEQQHGSLLKGMICLMKEKKKLKEIHPQDQQQTQKSTSGFGGQLKSFPQGMNQVIQSLTQLYAKDINLNSEVREVQKATSGFRLMVKETPYAIDQLFVCTPAYQAAKILSRVSSVVESELLKVEYAPVAVVGLIFKKEEISSLPQGFGYLIPTSEHSLVLGVLFESFIFPTRGDESEILFRLMIGGARYPQILEKDDEQLTELAEEALSKSVHLTAKPIQKILVRWPKAIPQYTTTHIDIQQNLKKELQTIPNLNLVANYLNGVSFNDCIASARMAVEAL